MPPERIGVRLKRAVAARAGSVCEYCKSPARLAITPFAVDHIMPKSRGGLSDFNNLALACQGCNNLKYTKTVGSDPISGDSVALFHPRQHRWRDHFAWNDGATLIVGITPIGRASVDALHLNRPEIVNLRMILYAAGEHPPAEPE